MNWRREFSPRDKAVDRTLTQAVAVQDIRKADKFGAHVQSPI